VATAFATALPDDFTSATSVLARHLRIGEGHIDFGGLGTTEPKLLVERDAAADLLGGWECRTAIAQASREPPPTAWLPSV
jgi:hypothetical protein